MALINASKKRQEEESGKEKEKKRRKLTIRLVLQVKQLGVVETRLLDLVLHGMRALDHYTSVNKRNKRG